MSNKASDNLHQLIKAMSKPEKRYFKVFSSRHVIGDKNNYQILFDAIDKQQVYDEVKLLQKFKKEAFINRFSIAKSRLYQSILKSLDAFHSNSSVEAQLKRQIHSAEILYNKSLYDQSQKLLISAKKTATKHQKVTTLLEIGKWEKRLIEKENYEDVKPQEIAAIHAEDKRLSQKIEIFNNLWNIKSRIFQMLYEKGTVRSKEEIAKFKEIIDEVVLENKDTEMFVENEHLLNHLYSAYYYGTGDFKNCYKHLLHNIQLIQKNAFIFQEEPNILLSAVTNAINLASKLGDRKKALELVELLNALELENKETKNEDRDMRLFAIAKGTELNLLIQTEDFEEARKLVPEIEDGLVKYEHQLSSVRKASFYFNIAVVYFGLEDYNEALKWINQLLNYINIDKTQDIHCMAQLLNLVIHLELDNRSLLPYTLRSTQRYLQTRNKVYRFETLFLKFVNDVLKKRSTGTMETLYGDLARSLRPLQDDPFERIVFDYFDFLGWAENKKQGTVAT